MHVKDASRCVGVVDRLIRAETRGDIDRENRAFQEKEREAFRKRRDRKLVPYEEAVRRRFVIDWETSDIDKPSFLGTRALNDFPLDRIVPYIDWSPFFMAWELKGKYPDIFKDANVGKEARDVFEKGQALLSQVIQRKQLQAQAVYGFYPAAADGDDIVIYSDDDRRTERARLPMLRQQWEREGQSSFRSLADFIAPVSSGRKDYLGAFAVSAGFGCQELVMQFKKDHDDYNAIMVEALADRLAEAFAELLHERARRDWGFGLSESLTKSELIDEKYRGIRPAFGYPSCPDHTEKATLWKLLDAESAAGIQLTETFAMWPGASVSGLYFHNPEAAYFAVDMITRDQVESYSHRKKMPQGEVERWLSANLSYDAS